MASTASDQESSGKRPSTALDGDARVGLLRQMIRFRRFEEAAARAYGMGKIYGFCHLHIGQEAIAAAAGEALRDDDLLISGYRIHTLALARGMSNEDAMFELFGRSTGCARGLGGSMHLYDVANGFYGGWGLVGQQVQTGAGLALAQKYQGKDTVVLCLLGDGAVHQGAVHETLNLAAVWELPVVFLVENNHYGMGTAIDRISALQPIHKLADAYKIKNAAFDGMDVIASYDAISEAVDYARTHQKPYFLEGVCSRFKGHSMSDPGKYRTRDELAEEKARDPITKLRVQLVDAGTISDEDVEQLDRDEKSTMKLLLKDAEAQPWPDESLLESFVFAPPADNADNADNADA